MGAAIALILLGLFLVLLTEPVPGRAAAGPAQKLVPATSFSTTSSAVPKAMTATAFLPLIQRQDAPLNLWVGEYYDNAELEGTPVYTTLEKRVDFDWGEDGSPADLPDDYFSIRWTGDWDFEYGEYTFFVYADDGVRLRLDGNLVISAWEPGQGLHEYKVPVMTAGWHKLELEYFEWTGEAAVRLRWRRTDLYPQWQGAYYEQPWVESGKVYEQKDSTIEFDWGEGCPDSLPCDAFSIAWKARPVFEVGTYRFYIYADEGYQLLVDGDLVKEGGWDDGQSGGGEDTHYDLTLLSTRYRQIAFNFHDRGGPAEARLWIQKRGDPDWTAEYYDNKTLSGSPVATKQEEAIFRDWGLGNPYAAVPSDSFSARWSGQRYFHAGCYRFGLYADDGVRLSVDGELLVDEWHDGRAEYHSPVTYMTSGYHDVVIEYYENVGDAEIRFWWE
jgi:hypothetical protein